MSQYASPKRKLPWELLRPTVGSRTTEDVEEVTSSFAWPSDSDEQVYIVFKLSLNEYNVLSSALDVGSDIAYSDDAIRVMWLWQRNFIDGTANLEVGMSNCCGPSITDRINSNTYTTNTNNVYVANYNQYETDGQSLSTIAPRMDPNQEDQFQIDQILCLGYEMMLVAIIEQAKGVKALELSQQKDVVQQMGIALGGLATAGGIALGIGGSVAAALVAFIGGPWTLLGLAIGGVATGIASLFVTVDISVLEDATAYENVLCTLRENGEGHAPSFAMFSGLLNPNTFPAGSNSEKLAAIVQPFLNDLTFFINFMVSMSDMFEIDGIFNTLPQCQGCEDGVSCGQSLWDKYHAYGVIVNQTTTYMDVQATPYGTVWAVEFGDVSRDTYCHFSTYSIVSGTFTPNTNPYPEGFIAWRPDVDGATNVTDRDLTNYNVSLMSYASTTPFTIRLNLA